MRGCNFTCLHYFILISSAYPKFDLLPPANEVWAKVMFSQVLSVHRGVSVWRGLGVCLVGGMVVSDQREGGLCPGAEESLFRGSQGTLPRVGSVQGQGGSQSGEVSVQGDHCPGDLCEGGSL